MLDKLLLKKDEFLLWVACQIKHDWRLSKNRLQRTCFRCNKMQTWNKYSTKWEDYTPIEKPILKSIPNPIDW